MSETQKKVFSFSFLSRTNTQSRSSERVENDESSETCKAIKKARASRDSELTVLANKLIKKAKRAERMRRFAGLDGQDWSLERAIVTRVMLRSLSDQIEFLCPTPSPAPSQSIFSIKALNIDFSIVAIVKHRSRRPWSNLFR